MKLIKMMECTIVLLSKLPTIHVKNEKSKPICEEMKRKSFDRRVNALKKMRFPR